MKNDHKRLEIMAVRRRNLWQAQYAGKAFWRYYTGHEKRCSSIKQCIVCNAIDDRFIVGRRIG